VDTRTAIYLVIGLVYIGYPLFYLMTHRTEAKRRVLGLGLIVYGILGLGWPQVNHPVLVVACSIMTIAGLGIYLAVFERCLLWLLAMMYCTMLMRWPEDLDPLVILVAALVLVIGFERCMAAHRAAWEEQTAARPAKPAGHT